MRRIDQRPVVVLAVDLDQRRADRAQHLDAHRLVVDEGAGAPVRHLHAAQDEVAVGVDAVCREERRAGWSRGDVEDRGDLALLLRHGGQGAVAAPAERERKGIEQDRFAGAGLARQDGQARRAKSGRAGR